MQKKILMVSLGSIGKRHLRNMRELLPKAEIAVYRQHHKDTSIPEGADRVFTDLAAAKNFAADVAVISSPASSHLDNIYELMQSDTHLFIEKPLATSSKNLIDLTRHCSESNGFKMVGYVLRFLPVLVDLRQKLHRGDFGTVRTAHVQVGQFLPDWRPGTDYREGVSAQQALGGGPLLELSHEIDYSLWLFGHPSALQCSMAKLSDLEIDTEDSVHLLLEYDQARPSKRVAIKLDFLQRVANMALQIVTDQGTLHADLIAEQVTWRTPENPEGEVLNLAKSADGNEVYLRQFDCFLAQAFPNQYQPRFSTSTDYQDFVRIADAATVMNIIDSARQANNSGARTYL